MIHHDSHNAYHAPLEIGSSCGALIIPISQKETSHMAQQLVNIPVERLEKRSFSFVARK